MKQLTGELLGDCAPYVFNLIYDIDVRMLFIECIHEPETGEPDLRIVFPDIVSFQEKNMLGKPDDENMDDIVSINEMASNVICITTYKKEMTIELTSQPFVEHIE